MEFLKYVLDVMKWGTTAFGVIYGGMGGIIMAQSFKDKTGPEFKQGLGQLLGGLLIVLIAQVLFSAIGEPPTMGAIIINTTII